MGDDTSLGRAGNDKERHTRMLESGRFLQVVEAEDVVGGTVMVREGLR